MKRRLATTLALTATIGVATAALPPKPAHCPSVDSIKTKRFDHYRGTNQGWITYIFDRFDTKEDWGFAMGYFNNSNVNDAYEYLKKVVGTPTPTPADDGKGWDCVYSVSGSYLGAIAFTLRPESQASMMQIPHKL